MRKYHASSSNVVESAYAFARSGKYNTSTEVMKALKKNGMTEGSLEQHFAGQKLRRELNDICKSVQAKEPENV